MTLRGSSAPIFPAFFPKLVTFDTTVITSWINQVRALWIHLDSNSISAADPSGTLTRHSKPPCASFSVAIVASLSPRTGEKDGARRVRDWTLLYSNEGAKLGWSRLMRMSLEAKSKKCVLRCLVVAGDWLEAYIRSNGAYKMMVMGLRKGAKDVVGESGRTNLTHTQLLYNITWVISL